ncbi:MAG: hypothetical protein IPK34_09100 [Ramlibacter sp.]|jgi:hypothetical protein|nr:hypothetical protein [Ramlibacter sp.]
MNAPQSTKAQERAEFFDALKKGLLLGAVILMFAIPWIRPGQSPTSVAPVTRPAPALKPERIATGRLAEFGADNPSPEARHVANWAVFTGDHQNKSLVILDKKNATVYVFGPDGKLKASTPVLLGAAMGDENAPGIGDKPLSAVQPEEKTTAAGRYVAELGVNASGEDVVWVDYNAALSMHRVRPLVKEERRLERLASPTVDDNRISYGSINLPVDFYENVLSPTVKTTGAVIYVLPETRTPQEVFGSYEVPPQIKVATTQR